MALNRWDPFTEMVTLRDAMNRLMEDAFVRPGRAAGVANGSARQVPMDIYETPQELVIRAALPGFTPDQVQISFEHGTLTIRGGLPAPAAGDSKSEATWHLRELPSGEFIRSLRLPDTFDADKADATFENGILTLRMPRSEAAKPRQIQVRAASGK
jgi:HSP20 family protein